MWIRHVLVAIFFFVSVSPALAAKPDVASVNQWREAEILMASGQAEKAHGIFVNLLQRFPGHSSLLLGQARSAALTGRYDEADAIYQELLRRFPSDPILLNESQQIVAIKSGSALGPATDYHLKLRAGFIYDTNTNQGAPDDLTYSIGPFNWNLPGTEKIESAGAYFGANFNLSHRFADQSPWSLVGDAGLYIRGNEDSKLNDLHSREWQWFRLGAGLRYAKGRNLFEFKVKGEIFDYDLTNHVSALGPELTYLRAVSNKFHLISQFNLDWRDYQRSPARNGAYGALGQHGRFFFGDSPHSLTVGAVFLWGRPHADNFGYTGWSAPVRLTLRPHEDWEISPHASVTVEKYRGPATILDDLLGIGDRKDQRFRSGVDVTYQINESLSLELNYAYNRDDSNSPLYDYAQHTFGLGVAWGF
jgi:hypothetical protein